MSELAIFDDERKKWIQYDEDSEVLIKHINKEELQKISQKADKAAKLTGSDRANIFSRLLGRASILGWRKIDNHAHPGLMLKGQPLQFTPENIDMLMQKSLEYSIFVNENAIDSKLFLEEEKEKEELKNVS